jgi:hypothetical protein
MIYSKDNHLPLLLKWDASTPMEDIIKSVKPYLRARVKTALGIGAIVDILPNPQAIGGYRITCRMLADNQFQDFFSVVLLKEFAQYE